VVETAHVAVGVNALSHEEQFDDMPDKVFGLTESPGIVAEGLLDAEGLPKDYWMERMSSSSTWKVKSQDLRSSAGSPATPDLVDRLRLRA
jgi:hypothetical protein